MMKLRNENVLPVAVVVSFSQSVVGICMFQQTVEGRRPIRCDLTVQSIDN
jgi:hypothetical protein